MSETDETSLPPETLLNIFESIADDKNIARTLVAVCKATKEWIEPLLYKSLVILTSQAAAQVAMSINLRHERDPTFFATQSRLKSRNHRLLGSFRSVNGCYLWGMYEVDGLNIIDIRQPRLQRDHIAIDTVERSVPLMSPTHVTLHGPLNHEHVLGALRSATHTTPYGGLQLRCAKRFYSSTQSSK